MQVVSVIGVRGMERTFETPVGVTQIHLEASFLLLAAISAPPHLPGAPGFHTCLPPASPWLRVPSSKTVSPDIFFHKD